MSHINREEGRGKKGEDDRHQRKERGIRPKFSLEECDLFVLTINSSKQTVEPIVNRMNILHFVLNLNQ